MASFLWHASCCIYNQGHKDLKLEGDDKDEKNSLNLNKRVSRGLAHELWYQLR